MLRGVKPMIFVLDIGNTNTVLGVFKDDKLANEWRIRTDRHRTEDEFAILFKSLFDFAGLKFTDIEGVIISSVVPPIMQALERTFRVYFDKEALIVGKENIDSHLKMNYPYPKEVGADRIVNAVGAIHLYGAPLVIIDFGTATTYCYVDENEAYNGGVIAPGVKISMDALYDKASKLPKIEIEEPAQVIGKTTVGAMQSGVYYGYVAQIDGIVNRIKHQVKTNPTVVATGGFAHLFNEGSETIDHVEANLTLVGLYLIYKDNIKGVK